MGEETTLRRMQANRKEPRGKTGKNKGNISSQVSLVDQMK